MDKLKRLVQDEVSWYMLFVKDIVLIDKTRKDVSSRLEAWKDARIKI